jgi:hypothetical protein
MKRTRARLPSAALGLAIAASACGGAPAKPAYPRELTRCSTSTGEAALDQQRAFLAMLLALEERRYVIARMTWPELIEATYLSDYHPERFHTTWLVRVLPDGALWLDHPEPQGHERTEQWYARLLKSYGLYACRDVDWLRWQAENRGVLPVGIGYDPQMH